MPRPSQDRERRRSRDPDRERSRRQSRDVDTSEEALNSSSGNGGRRRSESRTRRHSRRHSESRTRGAGGGGSGERDRERDREHRRRSVDREREREERERERRRERERERLRMQAMQAEQERERQRILAVQQDHDDTSSSDSDLEGALPPSPRRLHKDRRSTRYSGAVPVAAVAGRSNTNRRREREALTDGTNEKPGRRKRKKKGIPVVWKWCIGLTVLILVIVAIVVAVVVTNNKKKNNQGSGNVKGIGSNEDWPKEVEVPAQFVGTEMDPNTWLDKTDFNHTFTDRTVGGLPVVGLFDEWDDGARPNDRIPPLNQKFDYGKVPIRGVNLGGWLIVEPFITPSFFREYDDGKLGRKSKEIVDEYTLCDKLGDKCRDVLEKHYATFVTEQTFKEIQEAGLDHVRMPFGYWLVGKLEGETFLERTGWRYLLRAIEWARKYGLRVKLDLHGVPGGANGWNHSGRLYKQEWLNGDNGTYYAEETTKVHDALSKFFAQPRYKNIITMYGLVNEPKMQDLDPDTVIQWSSDTYDLIKKNGLTEAKIVFGDGFRGLEKWKGAFPGKRDMVLDVHNYVIFDVGLIRLSHTDKINFACNAWSDQLDLAMDRSTGYGQIFVGEWGQADTDCTQYLNDVGAGSRWEGNIDFPLVGDPQCPAPDKSACSCEMASSHPSKYSAAYKEFLYKFAVAQMDAFERSWGWMYWTWDTEDAWQWSYKKGMQYGIIPKNVYQRSFKCGDPVPDFSNSLGVGGR